MRSCLVFGALTVATGCAQPSSLQGDAGGFRRDGGGHLQFDNDAGTAYHAPADFAGAPIDFSVAGDLAGLPDLLPPGDLAGAPPAPDMACSATKENCFNNIDDDCNGRINDGCPDTLSVGADVPLTAYGGTGGSAQSIHCPANQVAIGLRFDVDDIDQEIAGVGVACSALTLVRGASSYSVTETMPTDVAGEMFGNHWTNFFDRPCDTSQFQVAWTTLMDTSSYVDGLGMNCALGTLTLAPTNQLGISFLDLNNQFGTDYGGGTQHPQSCGPSQAIVGYNGRIGNWMDRIQPICAPIVVNYK